MPTIADVKKDYPEFADLDDNGVVDAVHQLFYSDLPREQVAIRFGLKPPPKPLPERTAAAVANDTVIGVANAFAGGIGAVGNFISPGNKVSKFIDEKIIKPGEASQSDVTKRDKAEFSADLEASTGVGDDFKAVGKYIVNSPVQVAANAFGSFAGPGLVAAGGRAAALAAGAGSKAAGRVGLGGAAALGGAMSGGDAAGSAYDLVMKAPLSEFQKNPEVAYLLSRGVPEDLVREQMATAAAHKASVAPGAIGFATGLVGAERIIAGLGKAGGKKVLRTTAVEAGTEALDEGVTQYSGQKAAQPYDSRIDPTKNVAAMAAMGAATGGIIGGGVALATPAVVADPLQGVKDKASQPGNALSAAAAAGNPDSQAKAQAQANAALAPVAVPAAPVDTILEKALAIEQSARSSGTLDALRAEGSPAQVKNFINDLATAKSPSTSAQNREQALARLEFATGWANDNPASQIAANPDEISGFENESDGVTGLAPTAIELRAGSDRDKQLQEQLAKATTEFEREQIRAQAQTNLTKRMGLPESSGDQVDAARQAQVNQLRRRESMLRQEIMDGLLADEVSTEQLANIKVKQDEANALRTQADRLAQANQSATTAPAVPAAMNEQDQYNLEAAALQGQEVNRRAEDAPRQAVINRAMQAIQERGGVASPAEAQIIAEAGLGKPYDRIDPTLAPALPMDQKLTQATGIALDKAPRETVVPARSQQSAADRAAEEQERMAAQDRANARGTAGIGVRPETSESLAATAVQPASTDVLAALRVTPFQRTAEDKVMIAAGRRHLTARQMDVLERSANQPFSITAEDKQQLRTMTEADAKLSKDRNSGQNTPSAQASPAPVAINNIATPAYLRKRKAILAQLVTQGFETVTRTPEGFVLSNSKTGQTFKLDGAADAQLARRAIAEHVAELAGQANVAPTEAQIAAGNYKKGRIKLNGLDINIENPLGSTRSGTDAGGKKWETTVTAHYGEFARSEGADGDAMDVFIGPRPDNQKAFIIDQIDPATGKFDEHKVMMGYATEADARSGYLSNYAADWKGLGSITEMPLGQFKTWLKSEDSKKPASDVAPMAANGDIATAVEPATLTIRTGKDKSGAAVYATVPRLDVSALSDVDSESVVRTSNGKKVTKRKTTKAQAFMLNKVAAIFGKQIQFFSDPDGQIGADGFVRDSDNNTIYLNEKSSISPLAIFGHELLHLLRRDNLDAHKALMKVIKRNLGEGKRKEFRDDYYSSKKATNDDSVLNDEELEEVTSDIGGNLLADPAFWGEVMAQIQQDNGTEAKGIIARLTAILDGAFKKFAASIKGRKFDTTELVSDMDQVRAEYRKALAGYIKSQGITQAGMQAEVLRSGQDITASKDRKPIEIEFRSKNSVVAMAGKMVVGAATAWQDSSDRFVILNTEVRGPYRRRGIATQMYQAIEKAAGKELKPAISLSDDAFELWKSFRPSAVAKDLRHWKDQLVGVAVMKDGYPSRITSVSGGIASTLYDTPRPNGTTSFIRRDDLNQALSEAGSPTIDFEVTPSITKSADRMPEVGIHYSKNPRKSLNGQYHGTGLKGLERERLTGSDDERLKSRLYFYIDEGKGVRPEAGVGGIAHEVRLPKLYDAKANPDKLWKGGDLNATESRILDAGYDGYYVSDIGNGQGAAVVMGDASNSMTAKEIPNPARPYEYRAPGPETTARSLMAREIQQIILDNIPGAKMRAGILTVPAESYDAASQEMARIGSPVTFSPDRNPEPDSPGKNSSDLSSMAERGERLLGKRISMSDKEKQAIDDAAVALKVSKKEVLDTVRKHKLAHPASQGWAPVVFTGAELDKKGKPEYNYQSVPYSFSSNDKGQAMEPGSKGYLSRLKAVSKAMRDEVRRVYDRALNGDKNAQNILAQAGWYKAMRSRLRQEFGGLGDLFADLLGATSPNTPVRENWTNAIDSLRRAMRGDYDQLIPQWVSWADKVEALELEFRGYFNEQIVLGQPAFDALEQARKARDTYLDTAKERGQTKKQAQESQDFSDLKARVDAATQDTRAFSKNAIKALPEYQRRQKELSEARELPDSLLPTKESGKLYGFNGRNVVRAMVDLWRVVRDADADVGRGGTAPKALNFSGNLIGFRSRATIDVWAARHLQRLSGGKRIASMAEVGVSGDMRSDGSTTLQFGFGQDAFTAAAELVRNDPDMRSNQVLATMNDDDLQAVVWFVEKELWTINNWTSVAGEGGSFELEANLSGSSDQAGIKALRKTIDSTRSTPQARDQARRDLVAMERTVDRFVGGLSTQMSMDNQGVDYAPSDSDMARLGEEVRTSIYEDDDGATVLASKALPTEGRYGAVERSLDLEVVARQGYRPAALWKKMLETAKKAKQDSIFLSRVLRNDETIDPLVHRPGVEIYFREAVSGAQLEQLLAKLAKENVEFLTVITDGRRMPGAVAGEMGPAVGVRMQYVPEFEQRYGMDDLASLSDDALSTKVLAKAKEMESLAVRIAAEFGEVTFAGQFWHDTQVAFSHEYEGKINATIATGSPQGVSGATPARAWTGQSIRQGLDSANRQYRETSGGEPDGVLLGGDALGAGDTQVSTDRDKADGEIQTADRPDAGSVQQPGGVRGGAGLLAGTRRPYQRDGRQGTTLEGLPGRIEVDGVPVIFAGFKPAQDAAAAYAKEAGLDYNPPKTYAKVNPVRASLIADAFEDMAHNPNDPEVKAAYKAMIQETLDQYQAILKTGLKLEFNDGSDPYGNPRNAILDVVENNHLYIFSTREGFGSSALDVSNNPLLAETEFRFGDQPALANDIFRAVHDYFGHIKEGVGFRADGEENAWRAHSAMYSPLARRAMTTETRGQNSWVNYGPKAEFNRTANGGDTVYADQKVGLLPEWITEEAAGDDLAAIQKSTDRQPQSTGPIDGRRNEANVEATNNMLDNQRDQAKAKAADSKKAADDQAALIDLRKRLSILKSIKKCLG